MAAVDWQLKLPPDVINGPALPNAGVVADAVVDLAFAPELRSAGDGDFVFFGVSIIEPPEFKPVRMFSGLLLVLPSAFGDIVIIEPPDKPKRGTESSFFGKIFTPPPHMRNSPRVASFNDGPKEKLLLEFDAVEDNEDNAVADATDIDGGAANDNGNDVNG